MKFKAGDTVRLCNLLQSDNLPEDTFFSDSTILRKRHACLGKIGVLEHPTGYKLRYDLLNWFDILCTDGLYQSKFPVHISEIKLVPVKIDNQEYPQSLRKNHTPVTLWLENLNQKML